MMEVTPGTPEISAACGIWCESATLGGMAPMGMDIVAPIATGTGAAMDEMLETLMPAWIGVAATGWELSMVGCWTRCTRTPGGTEEGKAMAVMVAEAAGPLVSWSFLHFCEARHFRLYAACSFLYSASLA